MKKIKKLDPKGEIRMTKTMDNMILEIGDEVDQIKVRGIPIKVTKKSVNIFI